MRRAGDGTIVNVSSVVGRLSLPGSGAYAASKAAVESMSDALRAEVESHGLDVVIVAPGPVDSSFYDRADEELDATTRSGAYEDIYELYGDASAMGGFGPASISPATVARAVVNAASATDPAPRYPVGPVAKYSGLARFVPKRLRDRVFSLARRLFA
jgi:NAD(P)-dependent dehydrogenase (short-subunit alcohol dehydrogenase family)